MSHSTYEKLITAATLEELFRSRRPDFRARNEIRNLKHQKIAAEFSKLDDDHLIIRAAPTTPEQVEYLEKRNYTLAKTKRLAKPKPNHDRYPDTVQTILRRPRTGPGGGIPLTRGEVAMLFLDGHAGDHPDLLDIRSQGYGDDNDWDGLTTQDVLQDEDTAFVWTKWEPLELWPD